MAINNLEILTGADQVKANHEKYKEKFKDANADLVNAETFLSLLVAEMTNQDPLEPTSNTEFITQMAQFSQLQYLQDTSSYSMGNYASSLVGKTVTVSEMIGGEKVDRTGVVTEVRKAGDEFQIVVDGIGFKLKSVQAIADSGSVVSKPTDNVNIGELVAKASSLISLYVEATKKVGTGENGDIFKTTEGFVESIKVKDGAVKVIINGEDYDLNDVTEVTWATIVNEPVDPTEPDDKTDNGETGDDAADGTDMELDAETAAATGAGATEEMLREVGKIEPEDEGEDLADLSTEGIN